MKIDEIFKEIGKSNIIGILRYASECSVRRTGVVREFDINQALFQRRINFLVENGYVKKKVQRAIEMSGIRLQKRGRVY